MFLIDDGSTDNTRNIVIPYIEKFHQRGYELNYIYQENASQSVALNRGLKMINGEFLVWPDADDWYKTDDALELLVETLKEQDESVGMVRCDAEKIDEKSLEVTGYCSSKSDVIANIFDECFFETNGFWVVPGDYIVRVSALDQTIKDREIYTEKKACQNLQILYPILYSFKCCSIKKPLFCILQRSNSYSRHERTKTEMADLLRLYARTRLSTIEKMHQMTTTDKDKYKKAVFLMYRDDILHCYIDDNNLEDARDALEILKGNRIPVPLKYRIAIQMNFVYRLLKRIQSH